MSGSKATDPKIASVITYFEKVDLSDTSYLDLLPGYVRVFFPKFGSSQGKEALIAFGQGIGAARCDRHQAP